MKNSIAVLALLLSLSIGCNKASDIQTAANPEVVAVIDRGGDGGCCCSLVVSSTYFNGLTICGLAPGDGTSDCDVFCTSSCGMGSGISKTFPNGKDGTFCISSGRPFRITNNGILPIQIFFICNGTSSSRTWIPAGGAVVFTNDCNGTTTLCTEVGC